MYTKRKSHSTIDEQNRETRGSDKEREGRYRNREKQQTKPRIDKPEICDGRPSDETNETHRPFVPYYYGTSTRAPHSGESSRQKKE